MPEKTPICNSKENVPPPVNCAQLYMSKSLYTQELTQSAGYLPTEIHQAYFHSDGGEEDNINSSLTRGMDKAMAMVCLQVVIVADGITNILRDEDRKALDVSAV